MAVVRAPQYLGRAPVHQQPLLIQQLGLPRQRCRDMIREQVNATWQSEPCVLRGDLCHHMLAANVL